MSDAEEIRARLLKMQSVGATILSNATYALKAVDALEATVDPEPVEPDPQPQPNPPNHGTYGPPVGTVFVEQAGGFIGTHGLTLDGALIKGDVTLAGHDVTVRNSRLLGKTIFRGDRVTITDSQIGGLYLSGTHTVRASGLDIGGAVGADGIHVTSDTGQAADIVITDSIVHNPQVTAASHYDGIQVRGVDGLTLQRVRFVLGPHVPQFNVALFLQEANGGNRNVLVEDCELNGGGFVILTNCTTATIRRTRIGGQKYGIMHPSSLPFVEATDITDLDGNPRPVSGGIIT